MSFSGIQASIHLGVKVKRGTTNNGAIKNGAHGGKEGIKLHHLRLFP